MKRNVTRLDGFFLGGGLVAGVGGNSFGRIYQKETLFGVQIHVQCYISRLNYSTGGHKIIILLFSVLF